MIHASTVIELALKSTLLPAAAFLLVLALARRSAAERHFVWSAAMIGLLAMPVAQVFLPGIGLLPPLDSQAATAKPTSSSETRSALDRRAAIARTAEPSAAAPVPAERNQSPAARVGADRSEAPRRDSAAPASGGVDLGEVLWAGYAGIAGVLLARLIAALAAAHLGIRRLRPLRDPATIALLDDTRRHFGIRRTLRLLESPSDRTPWAFGLLRPVIVVPVGFARWPMAARRNALLHELAHVARFDHATAVLARACAALYWIQPFVWLARRRLALEAERACDDHVLTAGASRSDYAAQLLAVASTMRGAASTLPAGAAMAGSTAVAARISSILDLDTRRTTMTKPKAACLAAVAAIALAPIAVVKSQNPAEPLADFADPALAPLASRAPVNSDELGIAVRAYLAHGLEDEAAALIAGYLRGRAVPLPGEDAPVESEFDCAYCVALLSPAAPAEPDGQVDAVFAALDTLEREARAAGDSDLLVRLAVTFKDDVQYSYGLGFNYLLAAVAIGRLSDNMKLAAANLFGQRGWYEYAKDLIEQVHEDPTSSLHQSDTTRAWLDFFAAQAATETALKARLVSSAADAPREYVPIYKLAPYYPQAAGGARGSVLVEFTVTEQGRTRNVEVIESSNPIFDEPSIRVAKQFRYAPRIVDGSPVAVEGVRNRITFQPPSH